MAVVINDLDGSGPRAAEGRQDARRRQQTRGLRPAGTTIGAALCGVMAAWIAAGSTGLIAHPLRHGLTWVLLGLAILLGRGVGAPRALRMVLVLFAAAAAVALTALPLQPINVLAAGVVLSLLAAGRGGSDRRVLAIVGAAVATLGVYRIGVTSISAMWLMMDSLGGRLGQAAGYLSGEPVAIGATFAGIDLLVLMAALYVGWLLHGGRISLVRVVGGLAGIAAGEVVWLLALARGLHLADGIDPAVLNKPWSWEGFLAAAVPWNLPIVGCSIFLVVAAGLLRAVRVKVGDEAPSSDPQPNDRLGPLLSVAQAKMVVRYVVGTLVACGLAAGLVVVATLSWGIHPLKGHKIVASTNLYGNWDRPKHGDYGRLSIGMYGMLEQYVKSLGGQFAKSDDLTEEDLRDATALIVIYPNKAWGQGQLQRIWNFVEGGGTLLIFGEHTIQEKEDGGQRFNDVLAPTAMRVRFDTAEWTVGGWMHSMDAMAHPTTTGILDDRFGVTIGGSVEAHWPARPLLVARWGWRDRGDPGNGESKLGNMRYDPGEGLGDVILAAEQPFGYGRVICFGDTGSISNGIGIGAHVFTSRLLAYIAGRPINGGVAAGKSTGWFQRYLAVIGNDGIDPQVTWRQVASMVLLVLLVGLLLSAAGTWRVVLPSLVVAGLLTICTQYSYRANEVLPDGRSASSANKLAYVDDAHLGAFSGEALRDEGLEGLYLTLMRSGYLTLTLPEFDARRIQRAGLIVSVAPSKAFTEAERASVRDFVKNGGIYILTVGGDQAAGSKELLADFGFTIHDTLFRAGLLYPQIGTPKYVRHFKSPYLPIDGGYAYVRFWTAWPIAYEGPQDEYRLLAMGPTDGGDLPVIARRTLGKGKFVVIGDTAFAMNKNLERMDGQPIEGKYENAEFWRWLLGSLSGEEDYVPGSKAPEPQAAQPTDAAPTASDSVRTQPAGGEVGQ